MAGPIELKRLKKKIDFEIGAFLDAKIKETKGIDRTMAEALRYSKKIIMSGGKRIRGAFMFYGYLAIEGKEFEKIFKASVSIELIHFFLLMHDDIMDQDEKRHGITTIHEHYKKVAEKLFCDKNAKHFGISVAIIIGDMFAALGNQVLYESDFDSKLIVRALKKLQKIVSMTVVGQSKDFYIEYRGKASVRDVLRMYKYKTAKYTFEGPLHLGAILGGAKDEFLKKLSRYAIPAGVAFQIQDDILGIFGSEKKIGKPVGSDIRQGKYTILVAKAFEGARLKQKQILISCLGNKNLTHKDIEDFKTVLIDTGALDFAKKLALLLVSDAKRELKKMKINPKAEKFLGTIADYMIQREL